jgi:hypothetical protein
VTARSLALAALTLALGGCFSPRWTGFYRGELRAISTCSDGSVSDLTREVSWEMFCQGTTLTVHSTGLYGCAPLNAKLGPHDDQAVVEPRSCPLVRVNDNVLSQTFVEGGEAVVGKGNVRVRLDFRQELEDPWGSGRCRGSITGVLERRAPSPW